MYTVFYIDLTASPAVYENGAVSSEKTRQVTKGVHKLSGLWCDSLSRQSELDILYQMVILSP